jgi:hypothetical protein
MPYVDENGKTLFCTFCDHEAVFIKRNLKHSTMFCVPCYEAYMYGRGDKGDDPTHFDDIEDVTYKE